MTYFIKKKTIKVVLWTPRYFGHTDTKSCQTAAKFLPLGKFHFYGLIDSFSIRQHNFIVLTLVITDTRQHI